jgi:hypothetical protein
LSVLQQTAATDYSEQDQEVQSAIKILNSSSKATQRKSDNHIKLQDLGSTNIMMLKPQILDFQQRSMEDESEEVDIQPEQLRNPTQYNINMMPSSSPLLGT